MHQDIPSHEQVKYMANNFDKFKLDRKIWTLLINEETNYDFI